LKSKLNILLLLLIYFSYSAYTQKAGIETIKSFLNKNPDDTVKAKIYEYLAAYYSQNNYDSALYYFDTAIILAQKNHQLSVKLLEKKGEFFIENADFESAMTIFQNTIVILKKLGDINNESKFIVNKGITFDYMGDYHSALRCYDTAIIMAEKTANYKILAKAYNRYGIIYEQMSQFNKAIDFYIKSLSCSFKINYEPEIKNSYNYLGIAYYYLGDYQHSLSYYQKYLSLSEKRKNLKDIAYAFGNIGMIYEVIKDYNKAIYYYQKSLSIHQQINNKTGIANSLTSIGDFCFFNKNYNEALKYYQQVLTISKELNDKRALSYIYENIGYAYFKQKKYDLAIQNIKLSLEICQKLNDLGGNTWNYLYLGEINYEIKHISTAFSYFKIAFETAIITGEKEVLSRCSKALSDIYQMNGDFSNAYHFLKLHKTYSDSLVNADKIRDITALDIQYQNEKEKQLEILKQQEKDLDFQKKLSKQKIYRNSFILGFAFMLIISIVIFRNLNHKQKLNNILRQQRIEILMNNHELTQMNHEIVSINEEISKRNTNITDSLKYAQKIQSALFPQQQWLKSYFSDGFVVHRPLEIVSGDFYWMRKLDNTIVMAVADCTGHGVPGAFMSVLGIAFLNEIYREKKYKNTAEILSKLRAELKQSIENSEMQTGTRDGMDIALCVINKDNFTAQFSGAINNLYIIRNNKLLVYKGDHHHIGLYDEEKDFSTFDLQLEKNDLLYMFTDGYVDQFGGKKGSKFLIKNFKELLLKIAHLPMDEQKASLEQTLDDWKKGHQQVDDILVLGIKI